MPSFLNFCLDSLDVRLLAHSEASLFRHIDFESWRVYLSTFQFGVSQPLYIEIPGAGKFRLHHSSNRPYEFVLINPELADIRLWNCNKYRSAIETQTGQVYVNFRSKFLQEFSIAAVEPFLHAVKVWLFENPSADGFCRVARADLAADVSRPELQWSDLDQFVSRARIFDTFTADQESEDLKAIAEALSPQEDNKGGANDKALLKLAKQALSRITETLSNSALSRVVSRGLPQTLYVGRFSSPLYARIYDKTASLAAQSKEYMADIWNQAGWDGESTVIRTEFSLSGEFLKDLLLREIQDHRELSTFFESIPDIWTYLTERWLKHVQPSGDSVKSRRSISDWWGVVCSACSGLNPLSRSSAPRCPLKQALEPGLLGYCKSLISAATYSTEQIYENAAELLYRISEWIESPKFIGQIQERRDAFGNDDLTLQNYAQSMSDTDFSILIRKEIMTRGQGS